MNKIQARRLLNVARALRESANPGLFNMNRYVYGESPIPDVADPGDLPDFCGTPACALGHYAARPDLQRLLKIDINYTDRGVPFARARFQSGTENCLDYADSRIEEHFGLDGVDGFPVGDLFGPEGCGGAQTPKAAALYIERFVARRLKAQARSKP